MPHRLIAILSRVLSAVPWRIVLVGTVVAAGATARAAELPAARERPLSYAEAVELLKARNRDVQFAQRNVEAAQADTIGARARPNPNLSFNAVAISPHAFGSGGPQDKSIDSIVQLSQLIERGNKRGLRTEATRLALDATRGDLADAVRRTTLTLAGAYYDLLFAQERARITEDTSALLAKTVAAAELRLKAGDVARADLSRIRVDQLRAENDHRAAVSDRERARISLAYVVGLDAEAGALVATDPWPTAGDLAMVDVAATIEARPDVRASALRLQAAEKARDLARALKSRDVTLAVQYERFPDQIQNNTLGFGVSMPLFLNYSFEGEIRRAEVNFQAAEDGLERTRALARAEIDSAWSSLTSARDRVQRYEGGLLKEAQRAADAAEFAYRNGALGVIDLLDARRILAATRSDAAAAQADLARALVAWQAATVSYPSSR
ncbi:MAG: TolC family protein [Betaproteobacteria bacterium]